MAYFIVIGTNKGVKCVVDEIKNAHLQHNVVTSGCILGEGDEIYYHWDVFNENGDKTNENDEPIALHDALTNQISHFKALIPESVVPNVFIISSCFDKDESETLLMLYEELCQIGGAKMSGLQVDIVLVGYDMKNYGDVTVRPHWRLLESLRGLETTGPFHTNILYMNNMDFMGAATNLDSQLLGKFLCYWSKMVCAGNYDPKATVRSNVYSIGMSEHQYDFRDLNSFFSLAAEEAMLDRALNNDPSADTRELLDFNYYKKIDLSLPWIDGLSTVWSDWKSYCSAEWDPSLPLSKNVYSVARHEHELAAYLNLFLKLYIREEQREIDNINTSIGQMEAEIAELTASVETGNLEPEQQTASESRITDLKAEIAGSQAMIKVHEENIAANSYIDADEFHRSYGNAERVTEEDDAIYASNIQVVADLIAYVKSDKGIRVMREAVERATVEDELPRPYPASAVYNMGRAVQVEVPSDVEQSMALPVVETITSDADLAGRRGCFPWLGSLFKKNTVEPPVVQKSINEETVTILNNALSRCVAELRRVEDVRLWWRTLCDLIARYQKRREECLLMLAEYKVKDHIKSTSLIDMQKVHTFKDNDGYYKLMIDRFLSRWFDKNVEIDERMTLPELIKHQVLDPLVGRFHTLKWDGTSPFVKEILTDEEIHEYIMHDYRQSKPFVEYVRIQESNIASNLNVGFFSNNQNIPVEPDRFRNVYSLSDSINPVYLTDFVNSLCVIQVMDIPNHIDALKDYKPRREADLNRLSTNIKSEVAGIIETATTVKEKARAIYDWICDNIAYDTTGQIHDAETCWRVKRGGCLAYSELFCHMAKEAGLTADIIVGKIKNPDGTIPSDKHSWVFVYTSSYDGLLIDPTWGAGSVVDGKFVKNADNSEWFDVSPYWMIYSHMPDQSYWSKLEITVTESQFRKLPYCRPETSTDGKDMLFETLS